MTTILRNYKNYFNVFFTRHFYTIFFVVAEKKYLIELKNEEFTGRCYFEKRNFHFVMENFMLFIKKK